MAADPAGVVLAPTVGPAVGLAPLRLVVQRQFVDKGLAAGRRRGGCERRGQQQRGAVEPIPARKKHAAAASLPGVAMRRGVYRPVLREAVRSEEHMSELQSLMRISYAVFCLKKKNTTKHTNTHSNIQKNKYYETSR